VASQLAGSPCVNRRLCAKNKSMHILFESGKGAESCVADSATAVAKGHSLRGWPFLFMRPIVIEFFPPMGEHAYSYKEHLLAVRVVLKFGIDSLH
jgi:hypothetical protein